MMPNKSILYVDEHSRISLLMVGLQLFNSSEADNLAGRHFAGTIIQEGFAWSS